MIEFTVNGEERRVDNAPPTRTLLDWLREDARLIGTKEGCNEGDCGACTVAVRKPSRAGDAEGESESSDDTPFQAINACIRFLPTLHGYEVVTIEHLSSTGMPHPLQKAFSHCHASQCGFCTPGFLMTAFAAGQDAPVDTSSLNDLYAGNLCRCTGYGPILEATRQARSCPWPTLKTAAIDTGKIRPAPGNKPTHDSETAAETEGFAYQYENEQFFAPSTLDHLCALCARFPTATIVAGATDIGLWVTKAGRDLSTLISVDRVIGFDEIKQTPQSLLIGAGASYTAAQGALAVLYPDMGELIRRIGSVQIRNAGTIGGNIANGSPIGDMPPALIAAGTRLHLRHGENQRSLPLEAFFLHYGQQNRQPGEVIISLEVPKPAAGSDLRCYKISKRFDQDISAVSAALNCTLKEGRIISARLAFGGMAGIPKRAEKAEIALTGEMWSKATFHRAMAALGADFAPLSDMRASAEYRLKVAQNLLLKYYIERSEPETPTRLVGSGAGLNLNVSKDQRNGPISTADGRTALGAP